MTTSTTPPEAPETQITVTGRLSYADIFKPRAFEKGKEEAARYKTLVLIPKTTEQGKKDFAALQKASAIAKKDKWADKIPVLTPDKLFVKDGDTLGKEETKGMWVVAASDDTAPVVLDRDGKTELSEADGKIYSGCYARVLINVRCQDNKYGKRVNANLRALQFVAHGEAFGKGRVDAKAAFGSLEDDDVAGLGFGSVEDAGAGQEANGLI